VGVGPDYVDVEPVDQVSPSHVSLELDGTLDCCELILNLDILVHNDAIRSFVLNPLSPLKSEIQLQFPRVSKTPMLSMQGVRLDIRWRVRWDCWPFS
jgi:hypothetical protein